MRSSSTYAALAGVVVFLLAMAGCRTSSNSGWHPARFAQEQQIEVQIVTVPAHTVVGGISYAEAEVKTHTSHLIRIPIMGEGEHIQSSVGGIDIEMIYTRAEPEPELLSGKQTGIVLHNLTFRLPIKFSISPSAGLANIGTGPGYTRIALTTTFTPVGDIHYTGEGKPRTFLRARWVPRAPEEAVISLYDVESANKPVK